jgi:site-specific recombinase XerD
MTEQFIQERKYLKGVTEKTLLWYRDAFKAFDGALDSKAAVNARITELIRRGIKPVSVNTWLRVLNAYYNWLHVEHSHERIRLPRLKEEQRILAAFSTDQINRLASFKPKGLTQSRIHTAALLMLDSGMRISEALGLLYEHCDFDNLVVKVRGKGNKHRLVPISTDVRKVLFRYAAKHAGPGRLMFGTRNNT